MPSWAQHSIYLDLGHSSLIQLDSSGNDKVGFLLLGAYQHHALEKH